MEQEPKISIVAILFIIPFTLAIDTFEIVLGLVGADDFGILDIIDYCITQWYFKSRGVTAVYNTACNGIGLIPYIGDLPLRTIGAGITIWVDRHPQGAIQTVVSAGEILRYAKFSPESRKEIPMAQLAEGGEIPLAKIKTS